jgi:hypothetical protein
MSLSVTPEVQWLHMSSSFTIDASLRVDLKRSASSSLPQSASRGARISGLPDSLPLRPARLFASLGGSDRVAPANRDFYFQAFDELVALFIAGYRFGSNWTISADGTFTHKNSSVTRCTRSAMRAEPLKHRHLAAPFWLVFSQKCQHCRKSDIYSIGFCVCYERVLLIIVSQLLNEAEASK